MTSHSVSIIYQFLFAKDWTELTRFRYRDGIYRPERPWTESTFAIKTYFERRGNDDWTRVYGSERWEERYELPMVNDLGSKLISMFVLHQQFNLLFAGLGTTMAGAPPTSTSAQPIPTDTSGQTLPHLPPFRVHFDHFTSSPYHPRITTAGTYVRSLDCTEITY